MPCYMRYPELVQMLQYYYDLDPDTFEDEYGTQMREFADGILSPATIESICQSTMNIRETIRKIKIETNDKIARTKKELAKSNHKSQKQKTISDVESLENQKNIMKMMGVITKRTKDTETTTTETTK